MENRPNILWLCTDSQRWDTLGCYGNRFVRTPAADRLAAEGVRFDHCYAQNPLCQPSRGAFLTGRYPVANRLRMNGQDMPESEGPRLVTHRLAAEGYRCGLSGKLHLRACDARLKMGGPEWWREKRPLNEYLVREERLDDGYDDFNWDHAPNPDNPHSDYRAWVRGQGREIQYPPREDCAWVQHGMPDELHQTRWCADHAIRFIRQNQGRPWLFSFNCFAPHYNFNPSGEFLAPYLDRLEEIPLPNYVEGELATKPASQTAFAQRKRWNADDMTARDHRMIRAAYWAMCDQVDFHVGRILDALEASGQRENTIVIFTSDHGEMLGDHNLYLKGPLLYDPAIRVPLIVSWPGVIPAGVESGALVELSDLAPTIMEATTGQIPAAMQTQSLWPLITGAAPADHFREDVYCEYYNSNPDQPPQYITMVRDHDHKLAVHHLLDTGELYDLRRDPGENHNRWADPAYAETKSRLLARLAGRMAMTCDPLPPRVGVF